MNNTLSLAEHLLHGVDVSLVDAARLVRQILDLKPEGSPLTDLVYCSSLIQAGLKHRHVQPKCVQEGFALYLEAKQHLRSDSYRDVRYLGSRLMGARPDFAKTCFSTLSLEDCEQWLSDAFETDSQFNKGRAMLHGLFQFAECREWCARNPIQNVAKKRVVEKEIRPLSLPEAQRLLEESTRLGRGECLPAVALLLWAGLRPMELQRLCWGDIDLVEASITIRAHCSKTGGVRQVDICPPLKSCLQSYVAEPTQRICPRNWRNKWRAIRNAAGFNGCWVQDVLRHTFATYHAKRYKNMALLQSLMGHRDQSLLRSRYVNMQGVTREDAVNFFSGGAFSL